MVSYAPVVQCPHCQRMNTHLESTRSINRPRYQESRTNNLRKATSSSSEERSTPLIGRPVFESLKIPKWSTNGAGCSFADRCSWMRIRWTSYRYPWSVSKKRRVCRCFEDAHLTSNISNNTYRRSNSIIHRDPVLFDDIPYAVTTAGDRTEPEQPQSGVSTVRSGDNRRAKESPARVGEYGGHLLARKPWSRIVWRWIEVASQLTL